MDAPINEKLEALLTSKAYHELSDDEKAFVLSEIKEEEYHDYHELLCASLNSFDEEARSIAPRPEIKELLLNDFREKNADRSAKIVSLKKRSQSFFYYGGVAAAILILVGIYFYQPENSSQDDDQIMEEMMSMDFIENTRLPELATMELYDEVTLELMTSEFDSEGKEMIYFD